LPTLMTIEGIRIYFYSNEKGEPPHVHVEYQGLTAKIWITPVSVASIQGLKAKEVAKAVRIVKKHEKELRGKWNEFFSSSN
jgi:hypothetical protein